MGRDCGFGNWSCKDSPMKRGCPFRSVITTLSSRNQKIRLDTFICLRCLREMETSNIPVFVIVSPSTGSGQAKARQSTALGSIRMDRHGLAMTL